MSTSTQAGEFFRRGTRYGRRYTRRTRSGEFEVCEVAIEDLAPQTQDPYFSLQHEIWDSEGWYRNGQDGRCRAAGAGVDPADWKLPIVQLADRYHLASAVTGEPIHAVANGWYWYEGGDLASAARALAVDEVPQGIDDKAAFAEYVDGLRATWLEDARTLRGMIEQGDA